MKVLVYKSFDLYGFCTWQSLAVWPDIARLFDGEFCEKKWNSWFLTCEDWNGLQMPPMDTMKVLVHESFELLEFCTWPIWRCGTTQLDGLVGSFVKKNKIHGFWDVKVGMASKCPQMNTMKVLVHKSFQLYGFYTWPSLAVWHDKARWFGGEFSEKMKFVVFKMWRLEWPPNAPKWIPWKYLCTKVFSCLGFAHGQVLRYGTT